MLIFEERQPAIRTLRGWAISVLQEAGAICECEEHGWMQDRADPHACERAVDMARRDPPPGIPPEAAVAEVREVLDSIGEMPRAVRFYRALGFEVLHGGEQSSFTSFRAGTSYLNLIVQPADRCWSWWGRIIFYVADVDTLYDRSLAAGYQPATVPRDGRANANVAGCSRRVNSAIREVGQSLPVHPDKRTISASPWTSQKGQQETHALQQEASLFDHLRVAIKNRASHAPSIAVGKT